MDSGVGRVSVALGGSQMNTPHHTDRRYTERRHTDRRQTESVWSRIYPKKRRHTDQIFFPAQSVYGRIFP